MLNPSWDVKPMAQHLKIEKNHSLGIYDVLHSHFFDLCVSVFHKVPNYVNAKGFWDKYLPNSNVVLKIKKS
jgi:hypothetical protein